jgi:hypothetical protein
MADGFFAQLPDERLSELRRPVGFALAGAMAASTGPFMKDDTIHPNDLIVVMLDAHTLGLASTIAAAVTSYEPALSRDELFAACVTRLREHLQDMPA